LIDSPLERYRTARDAAVGALDDLRGTIAADPIWYGAADDVATLERSAERLRDGRFILAVVGEFSSGKSFLLNALLGKVQHEERLGSKRIIGLLATDINPSTATITELSYAHEEIATAHYPDGREERIPLGRLSRFVAVGDEAKVHDATGDERGAPDLVRVGVDSAFLRNGFVVADTPGLASINPAHRRATLAYLPGADAVLYLIDTQQPFTDGDASFLGIVRRYIESIFIVQTKIDLWRMRDGEREAWQHASARIVAQASVHAPGTPVFPLSARDYAEGLLTGNDDLLAQSRFREFLAALDASLVATTGRSRLRRAAADARRLATRAADAYAREANALELPVADLDAQRSALVPALEALEASTASAVAALEAAGSVLQAEIVAGGAAMRDGLQRTLGRAFDIADVARLRDRAKLHIIVDETLASAIGRFAADTADAVGRRLREATKAAVGSIVSGTTDADPARNLRDLLDALAAERLPVTEDAARAFDGDPSSGTWSTDLETGLRSSIVLGALGGPAVGLVEAIAGGFRSAQQGAYMKRELLADLDARFFPAFDREVAAYIETIAERVAAIAARLGARVAGIAPRIRSEALGVVERALAAHAAGTDRAAAARAARERATSVGSIATRIDTVSETFARTSRLERAELADPAVPLDAAAGRERIDTAESARFDPQTYEHGLNPRRWRVAVVGAFKRGKSSLINALAGEKILRDEGNDAEMRFPVHVRYGPEVRAYVLGDDAGWNPIPPDAMLERSAAAPVLIEVPWSLPRELVLVHTPAFDSGFPLAEQITLAAAGSASEILALFSRQLSDRELDLYGRMSALGKPMTFVHTIADNEESAERRNVVALADRYLRERAIVPQRIFTTSTLDYRDARTEQRAPAGWNELGALATTLTSHAEEHMQRLERAQREADEQARLAARASTTAPNGQSTSFFGRFFGRK